VQSLADAVVHPAPTKRSDGDGDDIDARLSSGVSSTIMLASVYITALSLAPKRSASVEMEVDWGTSTSSRTSDRSERTSTRSG
jgi:hypothetical protein